MPDWETPSDGRGVIKIFALTARRSQVGYQTVRKPHSTRDFVLQDETQRRDLETVVSLEPSSLLRLSFRGSRIPSRIAIRSSSGFGFVACQALSPLPLHLCGSQASPMSLRLSMRRLRLTSLLLTYLEVSSRVANLLFYLDCHFPLLTLRGCYRM